MRAVIRQSKSGSCHVLFVGLALVDFGILILTNSIITNKHALIEGYLGFSLSHHPYCIDTPILEEITGLVNCRLSYLCSESWPVWDARSTTVVPLNSSQETGVSDSCVK